MQAGRPSVWQLAVSPLTNSELKGRFKREKEFLEIICENQKMSREIHNSVSTEAEPSHDTGAGRNQVPSWHMGISRAMLTQLQGSNGIVAVWAVTWDSKGTLGRQGMKSQTMNAIHRKLDFNISICLNRNSFCACYPAHQLS